MLTKDEQALVAYLRENHVRDLDGDHAESAINALLAIVARLTSERAHAVAFLRMLATQAQDKSATAASKALYDAANEIKQGAHIPKALRRG